MTTETHYSRLRDTLTAGLTQMEQSAKPFDEAIIEVAKAAAALGVFTMGARATAAGLRALADQIDGEIEDTETRH